MQTIILSLHIIVCVMLVILVLLQAGKEGMGVIFGGGSSSVFGSSGAGGMLAKLTAFMAVIFIFTSLSYTYVTSVKPVNESVILDVKLEEMQPTPAKPAVTPATPASPAAQEAVKPAAPEAAKPADAAKDSKEAKASKDTKDSKDVKEAKEPKGAAKPAAPATPAAPAPKQ